MATNAANQQSFVDTALHRSVRSANLTETLEALRSSGTNPNQRDSNIWWSYVHVATTSASRETENSYVPIVHALTNAGCDVNAKDVKGRSPVYYAITCEVPAILEALLRCGTQIDEEFNNLLSLTAGRQCERLLQDTLSKFVPGMVVSLRNNDPARVKTLVNYLWCRIPFEENSETTTEVVTHSNKKPIETKESGNKGILNSSGKRKHQLGKLKLQLCNAATYYDLENQNCTKDTSNSEMNFRTKSEHEKIKEFLSKQRISIEFVHAALAGDEVLMMQLLMDEKFNNSLLINAKLDDKLPDLRKTVIKLGHHHILHLLPDKNGPLTPLITEGATAQLQLLPTSTTTQQSIGESGNGNDCLHILKGERNLQAKQMNCSDKDDNRCIGTENEARASESIARSIERLLNVGQQHLEKSSKSKKDGLKMSISAPLLSISKPPLVLSITGMASACGANGIELHPTSQLDYLIQKQAQFNDDKQLLGEELKEIGISSDEIVLHSEWNYLYQSRSKKNKTKGLFQKLKMAKKPDTK